MAQTMYHMVRVPTSVQHSQCHWASRNSSVNSYLGRDKKLGWGEEFDSCSLLCGEVLIL